MTRSLLVILLLLLTSTARSHNPSPSPYLSPHTFFPNHRKMLLNFKIYIYPQNNDNNRYRHEDPTASAFCSALLTSPTFLTSDPNDAHLFFIPHITSALSPRSISRHIRDLRTAYPFWNRTLGADHFYLNAAGLGHESDRNLVELKKNAIQISSFPTAPARFIPHKDIALPPAVLSTLSDSEWSKLLNSRYCLMRYEDGSVGRIGEAMGRGCVPVVVVGEGGGVQDLPLTGVVRWGEMAVFVRVGVEVEVDVEEMVRRVSGGGYERMRELGAAAAKHLAWGVAGDEQQYDAFHSAMYQLWVRRHTIRYARVDG